MLTLPDQLAGAYLFPCVPNGKEPATKDGWHEASNDPKQIAEWHRANPDFNWALATGPSELFVIDVDPNGLDWWSKLLERDPEIRGAVERAFQVRTPRGGLHVYFRGEGPSTASRIADGIDTRGGIKRDGKIVSGGYVLLPGSKTPAGSYSALPGGAIEGLPAAVSGIVPARKKSDTLGLAKNPDADTPRNISWAIDLLKGYVTSGRVSRQGAGGNNLAFQVAASILDKAISPGMAFDLMWQHWNPHCQPPWDDFELETIIRNAANYGEDTGAGVKGFQANADAFSAFVGMEMPPEMKEAKEERNNRDKLQWLHDYADGVRDPEWLIPGMIPARGVGMVYGESGSYKSFIALDMALCLAFGIPGQWSAPPVKNDVLFLAGEGPVATAKKRWPAWMEWQSVEFRNDHRMIVKDRIPFFSDADAWENVKKDLAELKAKPALIVIDTLTRLMVGMDENATKDATMTTNFLEQLSRYYECFVLAIHHTGKDQNKGARGSSAFYANMDTVISTKLKAGGTEVRVRKQKDADVAEESFHFVVKEVAASIVLERSTTMLEDEKGDKLTSSRYPWATAKEIVALLQTLGGEASHSILIQELMSRNGIDKDIVLKQLAKATDLSWLRPDNRLWKIPSQEYDL